MATVNTETNITFPVVELNIQLNTNVAGMQSFKRGMLKLPKMPDAPEMTSELPFFTRNVRYPSYIQNADWKTRFEFFFDRDVFVETLRKEIANDPSIFKRPEDIEADEKSKPKKNDASETNESSKKLTKKSSIKSSKKKNRTGEEWLLYTEKQNVMITLRSIFPIPEIFGTALKNSYDHNIMKKRNGRIAYDLDIKSAFNFFGFMYKFGIASKEEEDYFLNVNGKRYEIEDVTWENDIGNHPTYSAFLKAQNTTFEEVSNSKLEVTKKTNSYRDDLNTYLNTLFTREKLKERYIFDIFQKNVPDMMKEFKTSCGTPSKNKPDECNISAEQLNDKHEFVKFFETRFKSMDDKKLEKYIYSDYNTNKKVFTNVKENLIKDNYDFSQKIDFEKMWDDEEEFSKEEKDAMINGLFVELKNPETLIGLIRLLEKRAKESSGNDRDSHNIKNTAIRAVEKLNRLTGDDESREKGIIAANTILSVNRDISSVRSSNFINDEDLSNLFKKLVEKSVKLKGSLIVQDFVVNNTPMKLNDSPPSANDKKTEEEEPASNREIAQFIELEYRNAYNLNNKLANSVNNIYEPARKTSNQKLYCLLRQIKTGILPEECNYLNDKERVDASVFKRVYDYYFSEYPDPSTFRQIEPFLYTGVDQVRSTDTGENSKSSGTTQEICVRLDLVEADKFENASRAPCKLFDQTIANEYKFLTGKGYVDGSILSKYRDLDFDSIIPNPMNVVEKAENETKGANVEDAPQEPPPTEGGGAVRRCSRKNRRHCKAKTLRINV
jgi:hypothetical protein